MPKCAEELLIPPCVESASASLRLRRSFPLPSRADRQQRGRCSDLRRSSGAMSGQGHAEQSALDLPQSPTFTITRMKKLLTLLSKVLREFLPFQEVVCIHGRVSGGQRPERVRPTHQGLYASVTRDRHPGPLHGPQVPWRSPV